MRTSRYIFFTLLVIVLMTSISCNLFSRSSSSDTSNQNMPLTSSNQPLTNNPNVKPNNKPESYPPQEVNMGEVARFGDSMVTLLRWFYIDSSSYFDGYIFDVIRRDFDVKSVDLRDVDGFNVDGIEVRDSWGAPLYWSDRNNLTINSPKRLIAVSDVPSDVDISPGAQLILVSEDGRSVTFNLNAAMDTEFDVPADYLIQPPTPLHGLEEKINAGNLIFQITNVESNVVGEPEKPSASIRFDVILENNGSEPVSLKSGDFYVINASGYIDDILYRFTFSELAPGDKTRTHADFHLIESTLNNHNFGLQPSEQRIWLVFDARRFGGELTYFDLSKYTDAYYNYLKENN